MSNINLRKDCEALYTFDERSFDSQRNVIQDRSGYGRHMILNNGVTVGIDGPDSFRAADIRGNSFGTYPIGLSNIQEWSFHTLIRFGEEDGMLLADGDSGLTYVQFNGNRLTLYSTDDISTNIFNMDGQDDVERWIPFTFIFDSNGFTVCVDGEFSRKEISIPELTFGEFNFGARESNGGQTDELDYALWGFWTRKLNRAEIDYLQNRTGPRGGHV